MATILLQAAGAFVGGLLGPAGSAIGAAAGALAGYAVDQALINGTRRIEGPRLSGARPFTAEEGASLARVYGTARIGGTLIWATRFEESRTTKRQGGKGGPRVTEYSYFANVAFALCEGEISGIRRIWADGRELDQTGLEIRVYRGGETQPADPLIEARQGAGNAPAYRGVAYVVLERFALAQYGNRIPQLQFEVLRPLGALRGQIRAVSLIPGATEYGLSPGLVTRQKRPGESEAQNRHVLHATTDLTASLDELQALCPNLESVALVATWFGDDLRAGHCRIRPAVTSAAGGGLSAAWQVSGVGREAAAVLSSHGGGAAYGGTPSDRSVMDAIAEIKARGLKVTLYPFIMMDVPAGNGLPDPYGGAEQAAYPWRRRITADPAPRMPGSADKTAAARAQVSAFCGEALAGQFSPTGDTVIFSGAADDWGYRRFVLHFAHLAAAAGGVDAFLLGSELRGLTTLRDEENAFPFVEELCELAADARAVLGPETALTYGADWSEYFGHQPADGSGEAWFHLDALWAHPAIDAVGIDNYMPLSDWRDADYSNANPDGFAGPYDPDGLRAAIAGGEGFDWYYASVEARRARERSPISDGAYGKHWVFRYKDLAGWWSNPHHNRIGGVEAAEPTAWLPRGKPIWFTELGCPAVDKGPNQPNVFPDPKSAENAIPYFSSAGRSDLAQQRFLEAHASYWNPANADFKEAQNPLSPVYGGRMVDIGRVYIWAWDARPFPAFPARGDRWTDGGNWHCGHWLNGRLGNPDAGALINAILADHGLSPADVAHADGTLHGYVIADPTSARAALEPIVELFDLAVLEESDGLVFRRRGAQNAPPAEISELVSDGGNPVIETIRSPDHQLPVELVLAFREPFAEYQTAAVRNVRFGADGSRQQTIDFPGVMETGQGRALLDDLMRRIWAEREQVTFAIAEHRADIRPGAILRLPGADSDFIVTEIEDGLVRRITARQIARTPPSPWLPSGFGSVQPQEALAGKPHALFLDLPSRSGAAPQDQFRVAVWQKPWRSQIVLASPEDTGFGFRTAVDKPADLGVLVEPLPAGFEGRIDRRAAITVTLFDAEAASVSRLQLLNGANAAAIRSAIGVWEIVQFQSAEEIEPGVWRLRDLLRGQIGTSDADFVMLDDAVQPAGLRTSEAGLLLNWRVGPSETDISGENFSAHAEIGGLRARLPLSPVHLRCRVNAGGAEFSWIRRGRIDADDWGQNEIPLGEEREEYQIEIAAAGGAVVRTALSPQQNWQYASTDIAADFGGLPAEIDVTVRQFSAAAGYGLPATRRFTLS
ncbi:baseplate multidomain protein megatron [Allomesorhizobium camelthorni]|uniref:Host specificity protein n=1 Tax=Allomesorhizobium camelthorni TaxID=475069 RepID=A0A6G4WHM9_9HYPH|nr:glycoside hydrolase/phage tail family protein [Mesorhizobium camelthorni]NGO53630.1 host specificity protein [Mesorhizobium camelthorni]